MDNSKIRYLSRKNSARFKRGLKRYFSKNHTYGWKAFHRRIRYRNMVWEKAPVSFFVAVTGITFLIILIDLFKIEVSPIVIILLLVAYIILTILEIWYVGDQ